MCIIILLCAEDPCMITARISFKGGRGQGSSQFLAPSPLYSSVALKWYILPAENRQWHKSAVHETAYTGMVGVGRTGKMKDFNLTWVFVSWVS